MHATGNFLRSCQCFRKFFLNETILLLSLIKAFMPLNTKSPLKIKHDDILWFCRNRLQRYGVLLKLSS